MERFGRCWIAFMVWWGAVRLSWQSLPTGEEQSPQQALLRLAAFLLLSLAGGTLLGLFLFQKDHRLCRWVGSCVFGFILTLCILTIAHIMFYPEFVISGLISMVLAAAFFVALRTRSLLGLQPSNRQQ